jgi:hypothetical protein
MVKSLFIVYLLKMEAVCSCETLVSTYKSTMHYNPENQHQHHHHTVTFPPICIILLNSYLHSSLFCSKHCSHINVHYFLLFICLSSLTWPLYLASPIAVDSISQFLKPDHHHTKILANGDINFYTEPGLLQAPATRDQARMVSHNLHMSSYFSNNQKSKNVLCIIARGLYISEELFHNSQSILLRSHCQCCHTFCQRVERL